MRPTINSEKHVVQFSLFAVASGAITNLAIATAINVPTSAVADVREGSVIKAVYVEMWLTSDDAAAGTTIVTLEKIQSGVAGMTAASSAALNAYANKKNVLYTCMGLLPPNVQPPFNCVKGWIKIPKGKQRFGVGDRLALNVHGQSNGIAGCGIAIYKEYF